MKKAILYILIISFSYADIIYLTIKKENEKIIVDRKEFDDNKKEIKMNSKSFRGAGKEEILNINIANFWKTKKGIINKYEYYSIMNRTNIEIPSMIDKHKLKIKNKKGNFIETFIIKAKPDRKKYYWKEIEKKYFGDRIKIKG